MWFLPLYAAQDSFANSSFEVRTTVKKEQYTDEQSRAKKIGGYFYKRFFFKTRELKEEKDSSS